MHAESATTTKFVSAMLKEYGNVTRSALEGYFPSVEPRRYLYDLVSDYPSRGGKMFRSGLCIATARTFGASIQDVLRTAVSIELLHNALLIHDDIEDESEERRGKPTLHVLHGIPLAINVGDALTLLSLRPLFDNRYEIGAYLSMRILEETERTARESAEGQAMELGWRHENSVDVSDADYLEMALKKTCWLTTIHPLRIGALIGTQDAIDLDQFIRFGFFLGGAFQIHDDLLNLIGEQERYGKEINGDIWEGKRTLMLIHLFREASSDECARLSKLLGAPRDQRTSAHIAWVRELMDRYGAIDYAQQFTHALAGAALHEFSLLFGGLPRSRDRDFIEALASWVFERSL